MMPNEITVADERQNSGNFLAAILAAANDPTVDAVKMETMANLAVRLQDREREMEFNRAKNAAIMDMPVITKDGVITIPAKDGKPERQQGRFARFEDIYRVVRPILQANNLALSFDIAERASGGITVKPILTHANGYTERGEAMPIPADISGSKNAAQAVGSSTAYGKRYTMCAMLNIVTEGVDDDGRGGVKPVTLPFEREQLVLGEASAAKEAGRYLDWFADQSPKDRAWMIQSGHHKAFGGQTQLTAPPPPPPPPPAASEPQAAPAGSSKPSREQRAREWVVWFKDELKLRNSDANVDALKLECADTLNSLDKSYPDLFAECEKAVADRLAAL